MNKLIGILEIGIGIFLASPADEVATVVATKGLSLPVAKGQLAGTALLGSLLILDGTRRLFKK